MIQGWRQPRISSPRPTLDGQAFLASHDPLVCGSPVIDQVVDREVLPLVVYRMRPTPPRELLASIPGVALLDHADASACCGALVLREGSGMNSLSTE